MGYTGARKEYGLISRNLQTPPAAREFYSRKVEELGKNLQDLEKIVHGKQGNLNVVEDGGFLVIASFSLLIEGEGKPLRGG